MIGDYLNESYEDDLVESIFEEVSEETWEAIEEAILNELSEETRDLYIEGSLKKGSVNRGIKDAFRKGEAKTRDFYSSKNTQSKFAKPKTKAEKDAVSKGKWAGGGSPTARGANRTASQDGLKDTEHGNSQKSNFGKTHYKTQTHANKMYNLKTTKPNLPSSTTERQKADLNNLSADEFQKKYRMTKTDWERKNK
jgi:hypothetical protein